jgi:asparagine synthase (glutamine-hydrolysing)
MGEYLAMVWPRGVPSQAAEAKRAAIEAEGDWTLAHRAHEIAVYVRGARPPKVRAAPNQGGAVIGDLFDTAATREGRAQDFPLHLMVNAAPADAARLLIRHAWGRYVAILKAGDAPPTLLRDPTGALDCLTWVRDEVTFIASTPPAHGPCAPEGLAVDWSKVGDILARGNLWSEICPLAGVVAVGPGVMRAGWDASQATRLWRPADHARPSRTWLDPEGLADLVDACVAALAKDRSSILLEISGGLDSAIVAASLARCGAPVVAAINAYWPQREGDERVWAQRIADRFGFSLVTSPRGLMAVDEAMLDQTAGAARPGLNAQDPDLDRDLAEQLAKVGAQALFTGQGGDGVFYQMGHPALAADILRGRPTPAGRAASLAMLARRTRTTVWSLMGRAMQPLARLSPGIPPPSFLAEGVALPPPHPWVADHRGVSPAKRIQIRGLTNIQTAYGDSLRGRAADLIHPLMAQPIIEACLAIPAPILALGAVDRPFARAAFADRLPSESLQRRSKGDVTVFFSKSVATSLPALRPFLLDGRLAAKGLIDIDRLEPLLHPEPMIWRDCVGEVMLAATLEAWVRAWERKIRTV